MSGRGNPSSGRQVSDLTPPMTTNVSAPDPTAGERVCGYPEHEHAGWPEDANGDSTPVGCTVCPATPDADDASEPLTEAQAYTVWRWDCECGEVNERGDADPDATDECDGCGVRVEVRLP